MAVNLGDQLLSLSSRKNIVIGVLMIAVIFMVDLFSPLWYEGWILYLIPLFFMSSRQKRLYIYTAIITLLIVAAALFLHRADNISLMHSMANRITGILGGWGVTLLLMWRRQAEEEKRKLIVELQDALTEVKQLSGLLPICATCKKIRDDKGYWNQLEVYIRDHSGVEFSHGICPECEKKAREEFKRYLNENKGG